MSRSLEWRSRRSGVLARGAPKKRRASSSVSRQDASPYRYHRAADRAFRDFAEIYLACVIHTLRDWGTPVDEIHLVGSTPKAGFLQAIGAHIFFDDQKKHVDGAAEVVPAGHVPGPHDPKELVIVAEA